MRRQANRLNLDVNEETFYEQGTTGEAGAVRDAMAGTDEQQPTLTLGHGKLALAKSNSRNAGRLQQTGPISASHFDSLGSHALRPAAKYSDTQEKPAYLLIDAYGGAEVAPQKMDQIVGPDADLYRLDAGVAGARGSPPRQADWCQDVPGTLPRRVRLQGPDTTQPSREVSLDHFDPQ